MLWMKKWGQFHVVVYMLSTLGGTVNQSTAAGKATKSFRTEKNRRIIHILDQKLAPVSSFEDTRRLIQEAAHYRLIHTVSLTAYGCYCLFLGIIFVINSLYI